MSLKSEQVIFEDGRAITVTEISVAAKLRLEKLKELGNQEIWKECIDAKDWDLLESVSMKDYQKIKEAVDRLNAFGKYASAEDFQQPVSN